MVKQDLIRLGESVDLQFVCSEYSKRWKQDVFIYQSGNYREGFKEYKFIAEDLTPENMALCVRLGVSRV